jgi:hypothetical protein
MSQEKKKPRQRKSKEENPELPAGLKEILDKPKRGRPKKKQQEEDEEEEFEEEQDHFEFMKVKPCPKFETEALEKEYLIKRYNLDANLNSENSIRNTDENPAKIIYISNYCRESLPCKHLCLYQNVDGSYYAKVTRGISDIFDSYIDDETIGPKDHFTTQWCFDSDSD